MNLTIAAAAAFPPISSLDLSCITMPVSGETKTMKSPVTLPTPAQGPFISSDGDRFVCFSNETGVFRRINPIAASLRTIASLKDGVQDNQKGMAVDIWLSLVPVTTFKDAPIFTIGSFGDVNDHTTLGNPVSTRDDSGRRFDLGAPSPCRDHDFKLSETNQNLRLSYTSAGGCETVTFASAPLTTGKPTHVAVSFGATSTQVYIQGKSVSTSSSVLDPERSNWNTTYGLQLFSGNAPRLLDTPTSPDSVFTGTINSVRLHDFALSSSDVWASYESGLPHLVRSTNSKKDQKLSNELTAPTPARLLLTDAQSNDTAPSNAPSLVIADDGKTIFVHFRDWFLHVYKKHPLLIYCIPHIILLIAVVLWIWRSCFLNQEKLEKERVDKENAHWISVALEQKRIHDEQAHPMDEETGNHGVDPLTQADTFVARQSRNVRSSAFTITDDAAHDTWVQMLCYAKIDRKIKELVLFRSEENPADIRYEAPPDNSKVVMYVGLHGDYIRKLPIDFQSMKRPDPN